jgi:hypothetical protein
MGRRLRRDSDDRRFVSLARPHICLSWLDHGSFVQTPGFGPLSQFAIS